MAGDQADTVDRRVDRSLTCVNSPQWAGHRPAGSLRSLIAIDPLRRSVDHFNTEHEGVGHHDCVGLHSAPRSQLTHSTRTRWRLVSGCFVRWEEVAPGRPSLFVLCHCLHLCDLKKKSTSVHERPLSCGLGRSRSVVTFQCDSLCFGISSRHIDDDVNGERSNLKNSSPCVPGGHFVSFSVTRLA